MLQISKLMFNQYPEEWHWKILIIYHFILRRLYHCDNYDEIMEPDLNGSNIDGGKVEAIEGEMNVTLPASPRGM